GRVRWYVRDVLSRGLAARAAGLARAVAVVSLGAALSRQPPVRQPSPVIPFQQLPLGGRQVVQARDRHFPELLPLGAPAGRRRQPLWQGGEPRALLFPQQIEGPLLPDEQPPADQLFPGREVPIRLFDRLDPALGRRSRRRTHGARR